MELLSKMDVIHHMPLISRKTTLPINMYFTQVKECALKAVDEILYVLNELDDTLSHNMTIFYNEVKQEIEKYER